MLSSKNKPLVRVNNKITIKRFHEVLQYDQEAGVLFWKVDMPSGLAGYRAGYRENRKGYRHVSVDGVCYSEHRLIWFAVHGKWPDGYIDHINSVRDDNRLCNLRNVTIAQNRHHVALRKPGALGLVGVRSIIRSDKYRACIKIGNLRHNLGNYACMKDAALAYDRAASYFYGEFATTNYSLGLL